MANQISTIEAKQALGLSHTAQDAYIALLIAGLEDWAAKFLSTPFTATSFTEDLDGGGGCLVPAQRPISAVASVADNAAAGTLYPSALSGDGLIYRADGSGHRIAGAVWPAGERRWRVTYTAGYAGTIPAGLKLVLLQLLYRAYHQRGGEVSSQAAGAKVNWGALASGPLGALLAPYNRSLRVRV